MQKRFFSLFSFLISAIMAFADYSDHGKPWDASDNYDSSHGIGFAIFILIILIVIAIGAAGKHAWDNHKSSIKEGFGYVAFFGGCILLFLAGKACSESHPKDKGVVNYPQQQQQQIQQHSQPIPGVDVNAIQRQSQQRQPQLKFRYEEYYETCSDCRGSGEVNCRYCGGSGWEKSTCQFCNGSGGHRRVRCTSCALNERSVSPSSYCIECGNTGYVDVSCQRCGGSGHESSICPHCDMYNHQMRCPSCNGSGRVKRTRQVSYYE